MLENVSIADRPLKIRQPSNNYEDFIDLVEGARERVVDIYDLWEEGDYKLPSAIAAIMSSLETAEAVFRLLNEEHLGKDYQND